MKKLNQLNFQKYLSQIQSYVWLINLLILIIFALLVLLIWTSQFGLNNWRILAITSGSMKPIIPLGSLVLTRADKNLRIGDVITFQQGKNIFTHRIVNINKEHLQTKGDANNAVDRQLVDRDQVLGQVVFILPRFGRLLTVIKSQLGIILLIIIPGTILIWEEIKNCHRLLFNFQH